MLAALPSTRRALAAVCVILPLLTGCSAIRFGSAPTPDLRGTWDGSLEIDGQRLQGSLTIRQDGSALTAGFTAPAAGLVADGEGEVLPSGGVWIDLVYDLECPGTARLEGRLDDGRNLLSGTVEARDCTGAVSGTFSFRR